jgi:hypothetical protein
MRATPPLALATVLFAALGAAEAREQLVGIAVPNIHWESESAMRETLTDVADHGFGAVRIGWKAPYDRAEAALLEAARSGLDVLVTIPLIDAAVAAAGAEIRPATDGFFAAFGLSQIDEDRFAAVVERLAEFVATENITLVGIEVGNEMNWSGYNGDLAIGEGTVVSNLDQLDAGQQELFLAGLDSYVAALARAKTVLAAHAIADDVAILSGGLADINAGYIETRGATLVEPGLTWQLLDERGAFDAVDAVGLHIYEPLRPGFTPVERQAQLAELTAPCFNSDFGTKPCWITEFGMAIPADDCAPDDTDRRSRLRTLTSYLASDEGAQQVEATFFYDWNGDAAFSLERCGTPTALTRDLTSTPALSAN